MTRLLKLAVKASACALLSAAFVGDAVAQKRTPVRRKAAAKVVVPAPKITKIDIEGLKKIIKPAGKPLLINFWATWCDPCREEFPDLIKLNEAYRGKIDFITISLDDPKDINTLVPKFLRQMKADMTPYLLHTPDESAAIGLVSKDWSGSLPLTILYSAEGVEAYQRQGKVRVPAVTAEIDKLLSSAPIAGPDLP
ncbi:MAG: TlpA family protein disulfide reductase [Pyrinomonadaceae bacterium]